MNVEGTFQCSIICEVKERQMSLRHNGLLKMYWDEDQLKGTMFPTFFWLSSPFRCGEVNGDEFKFTVHFATPCQQFSMEVSGRVDGDVLTGTVNNPTGIYRLEGKRCAG